MAVGEALVGGGEVLVGAGAAMVAATEDRNGVVAAGEALVAIEVEHMGGVAPGPLVDGAEEAMEVIAEAKEEVVGGVDWFLQRMFRFGKCILLINNLLKF